MAESVLKLRVESKEYDSKIKRATEGLKAMEQECRSVGGTLEIVEKEQMEFVQALGKMDTVAKNTKGQLREFQQSLSDLTVMYRGLSDEEKKSPFGQALSKSIKQLTERAGAAKDAMMDVQEAVKNAASDTRSFDQAVGIMTTATSGFQTLTGAAELFGIEGMDNVEVLAKLQAAMAVTNGLSTIQAALQEQSAMMQGLNALKTTAAATAHGLYALACGNATAAQEAFNVAASSNPWGALLTVVGLATAAIVTYATTTDHATEAEKREKAVTEAHNEVMKLKASATKKANESYIDYIAHIRQCIAVAKDENASIKERNSACEELNRLEPKIAANIDSTTGAFRAQGTEITKLTGKLDTYYRMLAAQDYLQELYKKQVALEATQGRLGQWMNGARYNRDLNYNRLYNGSESASERTAMHSFGPQLGISQESPENKRYRENYEYYDESLQKATTAYNNTTAELNVVNSDIKSVHDSFVELNKQNGGWSPVALEPAKVTGTGSGRVGRGGSGGSTSSTKAITPGSIADYENQIKTLQDQLSQTTDYAAYSAIQAKIDELNSIIDYIKTGGTFPEFGQGGKFADNNFVDLFPQSTPNADTKLNGGHLMKQLREENKKPSAVEGMDQLVGGISSMTSDLEKLGIDLPEELQGVLGGIQTVCSILMTISTIVSAIQIMTTAKTLVPLLAHGGVVHAANGYVPGNMMSGDNVPAMLNSGELVLNRAQTGNLATQLGGGAINNLHLETVISGENLRVVLNNNSRRRGKGEYVTSKG